MRALTVEKPKSHPRVVSRSPSKADADGLLLRLSAGALNFADLLMVEGTYQETPEPPFTLGLEGVGRDVASNRRFAVCGVPGTLADEGVFPPERCVPVPDGLPDEIAAGLPIAYGTAHLALCRAGLSPGDRLLVTGAGGGVGLAAVDLGRLMGATVIAAARGTAHLDAARAAGAEETIDTATEDLRETLLTTGRVDVVFDTIGGALFEAAFRAVVPGARMLLIGFAGGGLPALRPNHMLVKDVSVIGVNWGGAAKHDIARWRASLDQVFAWAAAGHLRPHPPTVLPLDRADEALAMLRERRSTGKIVLIP